MYFRTSSYAPEGRNQSPLFIVKHSKNKDRLVHRRNGSYMYVEKSNSVNVWSFNSVQQYTIGNHLLETNLHFR